MSEDIDEIGPIDYLLLEWSGEVPSGEAIPHLVYLVEIGVIRILDVAFVARKVDGSVSRLTASDLGPDAEPFSALEDASAEILSNADLARAAVVLGAGKVAVLLVYENRWAVPFASAVRRSGGQLVATGRIPIQALIARLDAVEGRQPE